jgi:hypothetical protein
MNGLEILMNIGVNIYLQTVASKKSFKLTAIPLEIQFFVDFSLVRLNYCGYH